MRVCSLQNPVSIITCFPLYSLPFSFQILQISSGPTPVEIAYKGVPSEGKVGCWGRNNPSHTHTQTHARTHTHYTHTFLRFVGSFRKCVGKISWHNVVGKFGEFYHKRNTEFYQYLFPQKSNFYWRWWLLNKLYKICSDDYDNNEYLTVEHIRLFTSDSI